MNPEATSQHPGNSPSSSKPRWYYGRASLATKCAFHPQGPVALSSWMTLSSPRAEVCVSQTDLLRLYLKVIVYVQGLRRKANGEDGVPCSSPGLRKELRPKHLLCSLPHDTTGKVSGPEADPPIHLIRGCPPPKPEHRVLCLTPGFRFFCHSCQQSL